MNPFINQPRHTKLWHELVHLLFVVVVFATLMVMPLSQARAQTVQNPQQGSVGLSGTVPGPPPSTPAVITSPTNGTEFSSTPIIVRGSCTPNLLVQIYRNNIFAGSTLCVEGGTFQLQIDLIVGTNQIIVRVFDALNQQGPDSNTVTVTYRQAQIAGSGDNFQTFLIVSKFGALGADPGQLLKWPLSISGGQAPYAIKVNWGDNTEDLISLIDSGNFNISHTYEQPGTYGVIVTGTDKDGAKAFLQLIVVVNGEAVSGITQPSGSSPLVVTRNVYIIWPIYVLAVFVFLTFWLGKRYEKHRGQAKKSRRLFGKKKVAETPTQPAPQPQATSTLQ